MKIRARRLLLPLLTFLAVLPAFAAPPVGVPPSAAVMAGSGDSQCRWESGFHSQGIGTGVYHSIVFDDGTGPALFVAGTFETADEAVVNGVAKWDGSAWSALGAGFDAPVLHLEVFDDGAGPALYATGRFRKSADSVVEGIAKWNGRIWLPLGSGLERQPKSHVTGAVMEVFDDGSGPALIVGGDFVSAGGVPAKDLAKWDGSNWSAVGSGTESGWIWGLEIGDMGDGPALYISGEFSKLDGLPIRSVAKWDGAAFSALGTGLDGWIGSLAFFDDGSGTKLYAGGIFLWDGALKGIASWDGSSWSLFGQFLNGQVLDLAVLDDGTGDALYAAGQFMQADSDPMLKIAKWDGASWSPIGGGLTSEVYETGNSLEVFDDGDGADLYVGGFFSKAGGLPIPNLARWDGASWSEVTAGGAHGISASVRVLTVFDGGAGPDLYAGGDFLEAGNIAANHVARWNGAAWSPLGSGTNGNVLAMIVFDDGTGPALYAGGEFTSAGGSPANRVAKWTGSAWTPLSAGINGPVHAFEVYDDGTGPALYAGGLFSTAGGQSAANIAKWDGSSWSAVGAGTSDAVLALRAFDPGSGERLFVGGVFGSAGGQPASFLASWDGAWSAVPGSPDLWIFALEAFDFGAGQTLHVGGGVTASGAGNPSAYSWDGMTWTGLAATTGTNDWVVDFASFDDGSGPALFAGGRFTEADGLPANNVAKWNGASWSALGTGIRAFWLEDIEVFDGGAGPALFAAGGFETAGGVASRSIARYSCAGTPNLEVPAITHAAAGASVMIPVELDPAGVTLAGVAFSLDYDQACLDPDLDDDGALDQIEWTVPGFSTGVFFDPLDTDGEIDLAIFDAAPPIASLSAGVVARVRFAATCAGPADAPVRFSSAPGPSFGDLRANDVPGSSQDGLVRILPGPRGDCNGSSSLTVADLTAVGLEIFDGDGSFWLDAPNPSFAGSPVGCDANATTEITAADVTCANRLLFGLTCAAPLAELAAIAPILEVSSTFQSGVVWLRGRLIRNGNGVGSMAYSLDLDPARFDFAAIDANHDGVPDRLRFPQGAPGLALVGWSAADADGELDVLLADLSQQPLAEGLLVEVGIPASAAQPSGFAYSADSEPTFGTAAGGDLPGIAVIGNLLFSDGFESGDTGRWTATVP